MSLTCSRSFPRGVARKGLHLLFFFAFGSLFLYRPCIFIFQFENLVLRPWTFFPIFCQVNQRFEIRDTRFVEVLISYQMRKKQQCSTFKIVTYEIKKKKNQKLCILQKKIP